MTKQKFIKNRLPYDRGYEIYRSLSEGDDILSVINSIKNEADSLKGITLDKQSYKFLFETDYDNLPQIRLKALETEASLTSRRKKSKEDSERLWEELQKDKKTKAAENKKRELAELERLKKKYERHSK